MRHRMGHRLPGLWGAQNETEATVGRGNTGNVCMEGTDNEAQVSIGGQLGLGVHGHRLQEGTGNEASTKVGRHGHRYLWRAQEKARTCLAAEQQWGMGGQLEP